MATCNNFLLHCMDFRIQASVRDYLSANGNFGDCDRVAIGGPCKDHDLALHYVALSRDLHDISHVILSQHEDCGGYGGTAKWGSRDKERKALVEDMRTVRKKVLAEHPDIRVTMLFFERNADNWRPVEIAPE